MNNAFCDSLCYICFNYIYWHVILFLFSIKFWTCTYKSHILYFVFYFTKIKYIWFVFYKKNWVTMGWTHICTRNTTRIRPSATWVGKSCSFWPNAAHYQSKRFSKWTNCISPPSTGHPYERSRLHNCTQLCTIYMFCEKLDNCNNMKEIFYCYCCFTHIYFEFRA